MARKRLNGVWRSGTGAEVWYTGLSLEDFQVKSREQFERNMRMVDVDTNGGISAVWQPGTDGHVCMIGMSRDAFVREDRTRVDQGLRLTTLRVENGRHDAIWRGGSGRQQVLWTPNVNELHATSDRYFAEGLRIVTFEQDFEKRLFYGVWRSDLGTGAQRVTTGIRNSTDFKAEDDRQTAAGLRLLRISSINGITGIWRSGSDGQSWALEQPFENFSTLVGQNQARGLRMVSLSVGYVP